MNKNHGNFHQSYNLLELIISNIFTLIQSNKITSKSTTISLFERDNSKISLEKVRFTLLILWKIHGSVNIYQLFIFLFFFLFNLNDFHASSFRTKNSRIFKILSEDLLRIGINGRFAVLCSYDLWFVVYIYIHTFLRRNSRGS